jgi:hypothetical protein
MIYCQYTDKLECSQDDKGGCADCSAVHKHLTALRSALKAAEGQISRLDFDRIMWRNQCELKTEALKAADEVIEKLYIYSMSGGNIALMEYNAARHNYLDKKKKAVLK